MSMFKTLFALELMGKNQDNARKIAEQSSNLHYKEEEVQKLKRQLREAQKEIQSLKNAPVVPQWKVHALNKQQILNKELQEEVDYYKNLLTKPMLEIAKHNRHFKQTYQEQQAILTDFIIQNKAIQELAQTYGKELGKSDEDFEQELDEAKEKVVNQRSDFNNNVTQEELDTIEAAKKGKLTKEERLKLVDEKMKKDLESLKELIKNI